MFDTVRNNSKLMMGLLFVLVIPSLVLFGIEGYSRFDGQGAPVAEVAGQKITRQEWEDAHRREVDRLRAQMPQLDAKLLDAPQVRRDTLERLVNDRVLAAAAVQQGWITSDARLARELQQNPTIAGLRGADGKIDMARYRQLAAAQGLTPEGFENQMRQDLAMRQVLAAVQTSALPLALPTDAAVNAWLQQREVQVQRWSPSDHMARIAPTEAQLREFHAQNAERYRSVETADVQYVVLDAQSLAGSLSLPEADVRGYYEQNLQRLAGQEQRRASHILLAAAKDAPAAEREQARAKAQDLLKQLRANPKLFAQLARTHSQDPGSASRGGDLDFFGKGAMVKPFEDAAFALQEGQISELVETDFGFHILQLTGIKAPKTPSFETLRPQLEADLRKQQAQRKFAELAETFSNMVYEQSDTLQPVADKLKLPLQSAKAVSRAGAGLPPALAQAKLLQALFAEDAVLKRRNTEAVELGNNTLVSARVVQHHPSALRPFEDVQPQVRQHYIAQAAARLAQQEGQARLAQLQGQADKPWSGPLWVVSREQAHNQAPAVVNAALRADPKQLPAVVGVDLGEQGYAAVRVSRIVPREAMPEKQARATREQFARLWGQAEMEAYMAALRKAHKAEFNAAAR